MRIEYASLLRRSARKLVPALLMSAIATVAYAEPPQRLIVQYKSSLPLSARLKGEDRRVLQGPADRNGIRAARLRRAVNGADVVKLSGRHLSKAELSTLMAEIASDPDVASVEEDRLMKPLMTPDDPRYNEQWGYYETVAGIRLPEAWDVATGTGVVVAVIDTGYRPHADLAANIVGGYDFIADVDTANDGDGRDADARDPGDATAAGECARRDPPYPSSWHGTHVAGTIAAVANNGLGVAGVAFNAKVLPLRVLGKCGGYTSDIADAIVWASGGHIDGVPDNPHVARVINMSLGGGGSCDSLSQSAINTARSNGTVVVVAAGNENANASRSSPANCSGVITVAAVNRSGGRAYYSNYGAIIDVAAPGGAQNSDSDPNGILSTLNVGETGPGDDSYAFYQGTSMAAPHVAGVAALLLSKKPALTPDAVETALKSSARAFPGACSQCGSGIVDAAAALAALDGDSGGGGGGGGGGDSGDSCAVGYQQYDGSLGKGGSIYVPGAGGYGALGGAHQGLLSGDAGTNFDLFLEQLNRGRWRVVAKARAPLSSENLQYVGMAGSYRFRIDSRKSAGVYRLCTKTP